MKIDKDEYYKAIFENNLQKGLKQRKKEEITLKENIKKEVDVVIYKLLSNAMYKFEYKDKMHKEILQELLDEI